MLYACFRRNTPPPSEKLSMLSPPQFFKFPLFDDRFQWKSVLSSELLLVWVKQMSFVMKYLREKNWWRTENHYRSVARGIRRGWNLIIEDLIFMAGGGNFDITQDLKLLRLEKEYVRSYYVRFRQLCCISFSFSRLNKKIICMRTINKKYCCGIQVAGVQPRAELRRPGQLGRGRL